MRLLPGAAILLIAVRLAFSQSFAAPAGIRPAQRHSGASILPGGRIIAPLGTEYPTGPGAFGLALSPSGRFVITSNTGPGRNSLTVVERRGNSWDVRQIVPPPKDPNAGKEADDDDEWRGVFMGL